MPLRLLTLVLCLAAARDAAAQQGFAFAGIPWRIPADSARARLERLGYTFSHSIDPADPVFARADDGELTVYLQGGRLAGFILVDPAHGPRAEPRFRALADSLRAALGKPDSLGSAALGWSRGLTEIRLATVDRLGVDYVTLEWRGPGMLDEMIRRWADRPLPPLPPAFTAVTSTAVSRVAVDTSAFKRPSAALPRATFRIDYSQPVGPEGDPYDGAEYEVDYDCARRRTRLVARVLYLHGRARHADLYRNQAWETPRADGHYGRGLEAVCRAAAWFRAR